MLQGTMHKRTLVFILLMLVVQLAVAADQARYDRIQLSAQATQDVKNDLIVVVLAAQRHGDDVAKLANEVNHLVNKALARVKRFKSVEVQTLDYRTEHVYERQNQRDWRVSQSLQLKSRDINTLSKLIGELQHTLMLKSMRYQVSREKRKKVQDALIGKAILEFGHRARIITRQLGHQHYRLVNMRIDTGGAGMPPVYFQKDQAVNAAKVVPTTIVAGKQTITVTTSGLIELVQN